MLAYGFRSHKGKSVVGFWLAAHSWPQDAFVPKYVSLTIKNSGIEHPVLASVHNGEIKPLGWKVGTSDTLEKVPLLDSVQAIVDESYFDWPVLPEAPSSLVATITSGSAQLAWEVHGGNPTGVIVERRLGSRGAWERIAKLSASATRYADSHPPAAPSLFYRVRAVNDAGESAYSNVARASLLDAHGDATH